MWYALLLTACLMAASPIPATAGLFAVPPPVTSEDYGPWFFGFHGETEALLNAFWRYRGPKIRGTSLALRLDLDPDGHPVWPLRINRDGAASPSQRTALFTAANHAIRQAIAHDLVARLELLNKGSVSCAVFSASSFGIGLAMGVACTWDGTAGFSN